MERLQDFFGCYVAIFIQDQMRLQEIHHRIGFVQEILDLHHLSLGFHDFPAVFQKQHCAFDRPSENPVTFAFEKVVVEVRDFFFRRRVVVLNQDEAALPRVKVTIQGNAQSVVR